MASKTIKFEDDYDIITMHMKVRDLLKNDHLHVPKIDKIIERLENDVNSATSRVERLIPERELEEARASREIYANGLRYKQYMEDATGFVTTYRGCLKRDDNSTMPCGKTTREVRIQAIISYLAVASEYCNDRIVYCPPNSGGFCDSCGEELESGYCSSCSMESSAVAPQHSSKKINPYKTIANFIKFIADVTGTAKVAPLDGVMLKMDEFCRDPVRNTEKYIPSSEVIKLPLNSDGTRGKYTMKDLLSIMKMSGNSSRNKDKWTIAKLYWGWLLYDTSSINSDIESLASEIQKIYSEITPEKESTINREYLCYKIFQWYPDKLGCTLSTKQFKIITTDDIFLGYEAKMKQIAQIMNNPRYPYIPLKGGVNKPQLVLLSSKRKMLAGSTKHSASFKKNSVGLAKNLSLLLGNLSQQGHIEIDDMHLKLMVSLPEELNELELISSFRDKFMAGSDEDVKKRFDSIVSRDEGYISETIKNSVPTMDKFPNLEATVRANADRFVFLLKTDTPNVDSTGKKIPLISEKTKSVLWSYIELLTESMILHYGDEKNETRAKYGDDFIAYRIKKRSEKAAAK